jgi:hypothetical protein
VQGYLLFSVIFAHFLRPAAKNRAIRGFGRGVPRRGRSAPLLSLAPKSVFAPRAAHALPQDEGKRGALFFLKTGPPEDFTGAFSFLGWLKREWTCSITKVIEQL